jgi:GTP-binding protein LepA
VALQSLGQEGIGIEEILEAVVHRVPAPLKPEDETLRGRVFDSVFDVYRGVVAYVRVFSGSIEPDQAVKFMNNPARYEIKEVGVFTPKMFMQPKLSAGDVGFLPQNSAEIKIGTPALPISAIGTRGTGISGNSSDELFLPHCRFEHETASANG